MASPVPHQNYRVTWVTLCTLVFVGIAVLFLGCQWNAHRRLLAELALAKEANRRVAERLSEVKKATARDLGEYDRLSAEIVAQAKPTPATAREDALVAGRRFVADHPEAKERVQSAMLALARSWPARAGRRAGFSDDQIRQWTDLFARQKGAPFYGVAGVSTEFGELDANEVQGKRLQEIVGDALYARYQELSATSFGRSVTARIATRAEALGAPLTREQIEGLAAVFGKANLNQTSEWDRSRKESAGLLSPQQQAVFDEEAAAHRAVEDEDTFREAFLSGKKR